MKQNRRDVAPPTTPWARYRAPDLPSGLIDRPRLGSTLERATSRYPVTVISAPSGYGKTMAVASWASTHFGSVAWLSLSSADGDAALLTSGIVESLRSLPNSLQDPSNPFLDIAPDGDVNATYLRVCQAVLQQKSTIYLVIDDAQRAGAGLGNGLLGLLLEGVPDRLRLILVGTAYLEMAMPRRFLTEPDAFITGTELAFDDRELFRLCVQSGSRVAPDSLMRETQGWPIATHMVVMGGEPLGAADHAAQVRLHHYVGDHVLAALPEDLISFILTTTICVELTEDLAAAVSGRSDAGVLLGDLADHGFFIQRFYLDDRIIYRWHPVFARQCGHIMSARGGHGARIAHMRAARFLEVRDPLASMGHLIAAGAAGQAVDILLRQWVRLLVDDRAVAVAQWCAGLQAHYADDPRVLLVWACAEDIMGERKVARTRFDRAVRLTAKAPLDGTTEAVLCLARLFLVNDRAEALQASTDVQALIAGHEAISGLDQGALFFLLGWTELRLGAHPSLAQELLSAAAREAVALGDINLERRALGHLASASALAGRHRRAREIVDRLSASRETSRQTWTSYGGDGSALAAGCSAYWSADFDLANHHLIKAIESESSRVSFAAFARIVLAFNAAASGEPAIRRYAAAELQALPHCDVHGLAWAMHRDTALAVLEEAAGHRTRAVAIARKYAQNTDSPLIGVTLAGVLRRAGDPAAALTLLKHHRRYLDISYVQVVTRITLALLHKRHGKLDLAHEMCESALDTATTENIKLPFCDGDLDMRLLLAEHMLRRTKHEEFIAECLTETPGGGTLDMLSEREMDVFRFLQTSRTIREIADDMGVSVNTVKTHQRSIYRKLNVQTRREAQKVAP